MQGQGQGQCPEAEAIAAKNIMYDSSTQSSANADVFRQITLLTSDGQKLTKKLLTKSLTIFQLKLNQKSLVKMTMLVIN